MSLFKQIQGVITILLLSALTVVMKIDFDNAREFTATQLFNNGKNSANVLALSLSTHGKDTAFMESSINAMFDGGYFEEINLTDADGNVLFSRNEKITIDGVPRFFIEQVHLNIPVAEAQVMSGWMRVGVLKVKAHPGPSYIKLWETFKNLCLLFVILGTLTIGASYVILKYLLESLVAIQNQAEAISDHRFIKNDAIPKTPELKKVVVAMNTMVEKVQSIYDRQLEYLKNYQELNFKDSVTGLHNRKYLVRQLGHFLDSDTENAQGQMFILSMSGMESLTLSVRHPVLEGFFKELAGILRTETEAFNDAVTASLPRNEYAVVLPQCDRKAGLAVANAVMGRILTLLSDHTGILGVINVHGGFASYGYGDEMKQVLSKTDYALSVAKSGPSGAIESFHEQSHPYHLTVLGKFEWKTLIEAALSERRFVFTIQSVMGENTELHREIYVNMIDSTGVQHRASYFMPMVIALGLATKLDQYVLENSARYLNNNRDHVLAVNLTTDFCTHRASLVWFRQFLAENKPLKDHLVFEIHEQTLIQHPDICVDMKGLIKGMGYRFGIDQFTLNETALDLLKSLNPDYIKVEQNCLDSGTALNALITLTDSLSISLIAVKVENDDQRKALSAEHILYFQGNGVSDIREME